MRIGGRQDTCVDVKCPRELFYLVNKYRQTLTLLSLHYIFAQHQDQGYGMVRVRVMIGVMARIRVRFMVRQGLAGAVTLR